MIGTAKSSSLVHITKSPLFKVKRGLCYLCTIRIDGVLLTYIKLNFSSESQGLVGHYPYCQWKKVLVDS